jgi:hypothetical protein
MNDATILEDFLLAYSIKLKKLIISILTQIFFPLSLPPLQNMLIACMPLETDKFF